MSETPWQDKALGFLQEYLQVAHTQMVALERQLSMLRVGIEKVTESVNDLRAVLDKDATICVCGSEDAHFDRSLCACGVMHFYCANCGRQTDECVT